MAHHTIPIYIQDLPELFGPHVWVGNIGEKRPPNSPLPDVGEPKGFFKVPASTAAAIIESPSRPSEGVAPLQPSGIAEAEPRKFQPLQPTSIIQAKPQNAAGGKVEWKFRPDARICLLLAEAEYSDKQLTELLKKIVLALEIPISAVCYGKVAPKIRMEMLGEMPASLGVVFGDMVEGHGFGSYPVGQKHVHIVPSLSSMASDTAHKRQAWLVMKTFKDKI